MNFQCYDLLAQALSGSATASRSSEPVNEISDDPNTNCSILILRQNLCTSVSTAL